MTAAQKIFWKKFADAVLDRDPERRARVVWDASGAGHRLEDLPYSARTGINDALLQLWEECGRPDGYESPLDWATEELLSIEESRPGGTSILWCLSAFGGGGDGEPSRSIDFSELVRSVLPLLSSPQLEPTRRRRARPEGQRTRPNLRQHLRAWFSANHPGVKFPTQERLVEVIGKRKIGRWDQKDPDVKTIRNWEHGKGGETEGGWYQEAIKAATRVYVPPDEILAPLDREEDSAG